MSDLRSRLNRAEAEIERLRGELHLHVSREAMRYEILRLRAALKEIRNFSRPEVIETQSFGTIRGNIRSIDRIARDALEDK